MFFIKLIWWIRTHPMKQKYFKFCCIHYIIYIQYTYNMHTICLIQQIQSNYFYHVLVVISQYLIGLINCATFFFWKTYIWFCGMFSCGISCIFVGCISVNLFVFLLSFSVFFFQKQFFNWFWVEWSLDSHSLPWFSHAAIF